MCHHHHQYTFSHLFAWCPFQSLAWSWIIFYVVEIYNTCLPHLQWYFWTAFISRSPQMTHLQWKKIHYKPVGSFKFFFILIEVMFRSDFLHGFDDELQFTHSTGVCDTVIQIQMTITPFPSSQRTYVTLGGGGILKEWAWAMEDSFCLQDAILKQQRALSHCFGWSVPWKLWMLSFMLILSVVVL